MYRTKRRIGHKEEIMTNHELVTLNDENVPTTTSLKVAEHFGKRHDHVMDTIKNTIATLKNTVKPIDPNFRLKERHTKVGFGTRKDPYYEMDQDGFMLLVMGFTGEKALVFKQDFIVAFNEMKAALEKRQSPFEIPQTLSEALMLAAEQAKQLEIQAPKVEAFETYLDTEGTMTFTEAAKALGYRSAQQLTTILRDDDVLFKKGYHKRAPNLPRSGYEEYFEVVRVKPDGQNTSYPQTRVTTAGLEWLRQNYSVTTPNLKVV
jgi:Rha family phage regulatory protein